MARASMQTSLGPYVERVTNDTAQQRLTWLVWLPSAFGLASQVS
jgi:hypothetical protein